MVFYRVLELAAGHDPVRYDDIRAARKPRGRPPQQRGTGHPPSLDRPAAARPWRTAEMQLQFPLRLSGYPGRDIARMTGHTIICGWGRVGRAVGGYLAGQDAQVVVVDLAPERAAAAGHPALLGDVTDDDVLRKAGIMRARALVAAINTDAENVYVTLSARALRPDLVIIARARTEASEPKLLRAGATRVVNPQRIGGQRIAAAALQPNVVEFLDVVMHDGSLEFRLEEVSVRAGSRLAGRTLQEANAGQTTGALVLALRGHDGTFLANPPLQTPVSAGHVLIAIGTQQQLSALQHAADRAG